MTQCDAIRDHLLAGRCISPIDALNRFGCFRLGARIHELKRKGYRIESKLIKTRTGKHIAIYRLEA